ncbi:MAG: hypothetical protein IKZ31_05065 [Lentisphaeria bacterium]|nr:hypothetical protein [Lentisphaeria bacterium]
MKFFQIAFLIGAFTLAAAENGSPDVIRWHGDEKVKTVQETGKLEVFEVPQAAPANADSCKETKHAADQ